MIRRSPTLIALNDTDVQDMRDLLERIKASKEEERRVKEQTLAANPHPPSSGSTTAGSVPATAAGTNIAARTKEERLGLRSNT